MAGGQLDQNLPSEQISRLEQLKFRTNKYNPEQVDVSALANITFQKVLIDEVSTTLTYVGWAKIGSLKTNAVWKIVKIQVSGSITEISHADGDEEFDNIWDDRASLTYA